jgi:hypothetical protein
MARHLVLALYGRRNLQLPGLASHTSAAASWLAYTQSIAAPFLYRYEPSVVAFARRILLVDDIVFIASIDARPHGANDSIVAR